MFSDDRAYATILMKLCRLAVRGNAHQNKIVYVLVLLPSLVEMALVPIHTKFAFKDQAVLVENWTRQSKTEVFCKKDGVSNKPGRRKHIDMLMRNSNTRLNHVGELFTAGNWFSYKNVSEKLRKGRFLVMASSESNLTEKQLKVLDSYLGKLEGDSNRVCLESSPKISKQKDTIKIKTNANEELESLNAYLRKLDKDRKSKDFASSAPVGKTNEGSLVRRAAGKLKKDIQTGSQNFEAIRHYDDQYDETSDLYLIGTLVAVDIAVFLFQLASPIKNDEYGLFSLPLLYGAKINDLIMCGEWWRLVTPMFLHAEVFHLALTCWSLLTFGPQVCRGYGGFTFFLIFILGGISGNISSFLHTPAPTICGTGPVFAIIGAWLVYQTQNKSKTGKDATDDLFQKAIIATGLSFILSHFGPLDDWGHLGAVLAGTAYGYFTCPVLQLDESTGRSGEEKGIAVVQRNADPRRSAILFAVFVLVLGSSLLLYVNGLPPELSLSEDLLYSLI